MTITTHLSLGSLNTHINFEFGAQTGSYRSCSAMLAGRMLIIGGSSRKDFTNQISEVVGCSLKRIGTMPNETHFPACNTFNTPTPKVWICFYELNTKGCKRFVSKLLFQVRNLFLVSTEIRSSTNQRRFTITNGRRWEFTTDRHSHSDQGGQRTRKWSISPIHGGLWVNFPSYLITFGDTLR